MIKSISQNIHDQTKKKRERSLTILNYLCERLQALIKENHDDLARSIVLEQGKTFSDAKGDVHRGLQVVEAACSLPQLLMGEKLEVSKDMDTETRKAPLGVTAAICP
jgi:malonate-semialdehyde dehydrogenase (acetylating)/methylmalonate-semialdehyde dehydrogenase